MHVLYKFIITTYTYMYNTCTEHMSDDEEEVSHELPTITDNYVTPPTQRRPPPSTLPTGPTSHPPSATSSSYQQQSSGGGAASRLSVGSTDRSETTSPRAQRKKWASITSNSFDLSGDEGGTPAVFGKPW